MHAHVAMEHTGNPLRQTVGSQQCEQLLFFQRIRHEALTSLCNLTAVAEDEAEEEWEVVPQSADVETDANANDMVPPPMSTDAAVDAPPISPFAVAQPAAGVEVRLSMLLPRLGRCR